MTTATEAITQARDTAIQQTVRARNPEAGHFGFIAQNLDWALNNMPPSDPMFTAGQLQMLRKALVTARRVELGKVKAAQHHANPADQALHPRQAEIYSGLISKIDEATK